MADITRARLAKKESLSDEICSFTFEAIEGNFESLQAGCHIDVHLNDELVRNYSVWEWAPDGKTLSVAVKREDAGRGGSLAMHALQEGVEIAIGGPRNNFALEPGQGPVVLVGGGIGVTPIYSMAKALKDSGQEFSVYYLVRSREHAAFDSLFRSMDLGDSYHLHCDDADGFLDFDKLVASHPGDTSYYVCGPEPILNILQDTCAKHQRGTVLFERFAPVAPQSDAGNKPFVVVLNSSGQSLEVPSDKSILGVLKENGIPIHYGCSSGLCGSCITDVIDGEIDHRDSVLDDDEKAEGDCMCICVSRAKSDRLVLDM